MYTHTSVNYTYSMLYICTYTWTPQRAQQCTGALAKFLKSHFPTPFIIQCPYPEHFSECVPVHKQDALGLVEKRDVDQVPQRRFEAEPLLARHCDPGAPDDCVLGLRSDVV